MKVSIVSRVSKITIGAILDIIKSDDSQTYLANLLIFFNMIGIFFLIVYSIRIRKMMLEMQIDLDQEKNTPSDYALLVRNIPLTKMNFLLAICKIHDQKEKKRIGCSIEELETHKDYKVPTKRHKFRFWRFRLLDKKKI